MVSIMSQPINPNSAEPISGSPSTRAQSASPSQPFHASDKEIRSAVFRLHMRLWKKSWYEGASQWVLVIMTTLYAIGGVAFTASSCVDIARRTGRFSAAAVGAHPAGNMSGPVADNPWTAFAALGATTLLVLAFIWPAGENTVQPAKLAQFPLKPSSLVRALLPTIVVQSRAIIAIGVTIATMVAVILSGNATGQWFTAAIGIVGLILGISCLLVINQALIVTSSSSGGNRSRRNWLYFIVTFLFLSVFIVIQIFASGFASSVTDTILKWVIRIAGWTPLASGPAMIDDATQHAWISLVIRTVLTVVFIIAGLYLWSRSVDRDFASAANTSGKSEDVSPRDSFYLRGVPHTVVGALFSRQLKYWVRDVRFKYAILSFPIMALIFLIMGIATGNNSPVVGSLYIAIVGNSNFASNDIGMDGPANWVHMVAGTRGKDIVIARAIAVIILDVLLLVPCLVIMVLFADFTPNQKAIIAGACLGGVFAGPAVGLFLSAYNPFPAVKPGVNTMRNNGRQSGPAFVAMLIALAAFTIILGPAVAVPLIGLTGAWFAAAYSLNVDLAMLAGSIALSAKRIDSRYPEIFAKVRKFL